MNRGQRNQIVVENLPLVGYLVSDLCSRATHLSRDEFTSVGAVALITAADAFDPSLGVPFGAFARRRIVGAFADEMRTADWATRTARRRIKASNAVEETLTAGLGRKPTVDELAGALGVDRATVQATRADAARSVTALDDSDAGMVADTGLSPEESVLAQEQTLTIRATVNALPETTRYIVEQIFFQGRTVTDLASELGISHSAVSQRRSEAMRLLRDGLAAAGHGKVMAPEAASSRIAAARHRAYLATVVEATSGGIASRLRHLTPATS